ncbi:MAG: hypothetical protein GQ561_01475 [Calditrichae bacterium]|nr:hypothetical protein [Calditrichia bacterium]
MTLYWDTGAESSFDPFVARANPDSLEKGFDFEGYKVYRSRDYSFNDTQTITDSRGIPFLSVPLKDITGLNAQFDLINEFEGLSEIEYAGRGVRYDLGRNSGLAHMYVDSMNVKNGVAYFYAVTSYDHGDQSAILSPTECQRVIKRDAVTRLFGFDLNTAMVIPNGPATGFQAPKLANSIDDNLPTQEIGNATGPVWIEFLDPFDVQDGHKYELFFEEVEIDSAVFTTGFSVYDLQNRESAFESQDTNWVTLISGIQLTEGTVTVREISGSTVDPSRYEIDYLAARIRGAYLGALPEGESFLANFRVTPVPSSVSINGEDDNQVFDGMRVFVQNDSTGLDSISTKGGRSGFSVINTNTNFSDEFTHIRMAQVGNFQPYPSNFEIRFTDYDTTQGGQLVSPADSSIKLNPNLPAVKTNFKIIDIETGERIDFYVGEVSPANYRWDWQEIIVLLKPEHVQVTETTYQVTFSPPVVDSLTVEPPVYPGQGDVFLFFSTKPFEIGDKFSFETEEVKFEQNLSEGVLNEVYVVPNPYIAYSASEIAFRTGIRDDKRIEFRNLPPRCTIRIYTIVGELVDTIEKNDPTLNYATWNLLSYESQQIAYGVYIYHIDAPGIGTKIGRFAVIK